MKLKNTRNTRNTLNTHFELEFLCTLLNFLYTMISWFFCSLFIFDTLNTRHRRKGYTCTNAVGLAIYRINQHRSYSCNLPFFFKSVLFIIIIVLIYFYYIMRTNTRYTTLKISVFLCKNRIHRVIVTMNSMVHIVTLFFLSIVMSCVSWTPHILSNQMYIILYYAIIPL